MTSFLGRLCFRHRWFVVLAWLAIMTGGGLAAGTVFERLGDTNSLAGTESGHARQILNAADDRGGTVIALWEGIDPASPAVSTTLDRIRADLSAIEGVKQVDPPLPASDGRGVALRVVIADGPDGSPVEDAAVEATVARLRALPGDVRLGGDYLLREQINDAVQADLNRAEFGSLPLTVLVMVFVFGGLVAAGVPLLATLATVAGAFAMLLGFSLFIELDADIVSVVSMMGLALCIDYSLLLVARYREELAAGHDPWQAVERTWATAGRTITFSALTVAAALTGLFFFDVPRLAAMGAAGISAAILALLSALTLTAALLRIFGRRIKPSRRALSRKSRAAGIARGRDAAGSAAAPITAGSAAAPITAGSAAAPITAGSAAAPITAGSAVADGAYGAAAAPGGPREPRGFFAGLARVTQRRPVMFALGTGAVLLALGAPLLTATIKLPGMAGLPRDIESVRVFDELAERYGRDETPAIVVLARTDPSTLDSWAARWSGQARADRATGIDAGLSTVAFHVSGDSQGKAPRDLVALMRADRPAGVESWVAGDAAVMTDLNARLAAGLPYAIGVVVLVMFVLLFLMTGSVVVPVKALLMNVVSLGATFGLLVAVFEHGWLAGPLDTLTVGGLSPFVVLLVFAFGFGLSMDYEVFLLARIKEQVDAGVEPDLAVRRGLQDSGRIITSAALLMLIVFGFFAAAGLGDLEQIGLGLFVAVLVDATIVRCVLVPATMTLLGRWNWWAPRPLRRIHARLALAG